MGTFIVCPRTAPGHCLKKLKKLLQRDFDCGIICRTAQRIGRRPWLNVRRKGGGSEVICFRRVLFLLAVIALLLAAPRLTYAQAVICDSIGNCQFADPNTGDPSPAVLWAVDMDGTTHVELTFFVDHDCQGNGFFLGAADVPVMAGLNGIGLSWGGMPPPVGFPYSLLSNIGSCDPVCLNYTHGIDPPSCFEGAGTLIQWPDFEPLPSS
jgi:hypothetical protein